jgi:geranylgeranylglycerol-phosphate geranylgeranyltransferase
MAVKNNILHENPNISYKEKCKAIYDLIRPELPLAGGICVVAGQIIVLHTLPTIFIGLMGFLTGFFISGAAMITNDYFDIEVDKINHPQRSLPMGMIKLNDVIIITGLFTVTGFITASLLGLITLIFAIIVWIIAISYNWKFKENGLIGNMMVDISVAFLYLEELRLVDYLMVYYGFLVF